MRYFDYSARMPASAQQKRKRARVGICLHATAGTNSLSWLQRDERDPLKKSSADYLVSRQGDIYQLTLPGYFAYHAGRARLDRGLDMTLDLNAALVGIEVECLDQQNQQWSDLQYIATAALCRALFAYHKLGVLTLVTHAEIAIPRGRKTDPATLSNYIFTRELVRPSIEAELLHFPEVLP